LLKSARLSPAVDQRNVDQRNVDYRTVGRRLQNETINGRPGYCS
jgi:hypothetical protein